MTRKMERLCFSKLYLRTFLVWSRPSRPANSRYYQKKFFIPFLERNSNVNIVQCSTGYQRNSCGYCNRENGSQSSRRTWFGLLNVFAFCIECSSSGLPIKLHLILDYRYRCCLLCFLQLCACGGLWRANQSRMETVSSPIFGFLGSSYFTPSPGLPEKTALETESFLDQGSSTTNRTCSNHAVRIIQ